MQGGQGYMFNNEGQVWASAPAPVTKTVDNARMLKQITGKDPLFLPWRMAPTGARFCKMTGETMLQYMSNNMSKAAQKGVNTDIKTFIPNFKGIGSEEGLYQFKSLPDKKRKALKNLLDKKIEMKAGLVRRGEIGCCRPKSINGCRRWASERRQDICRQANY